MRRVAWFALVEKTKLKTIICNEMILKPVHKQQGCLEREKFYPRMSRKGTRNILGFIRESKCLDTTLIFIQTRSSKIIVHVCVYYSLVFRWQQFLKNISAYDSSIYQVCRVLAYNCT